MKDNSIKFRTDKKYKWVDRLLKHGDRPWMGLIISMAALTVILMLAIGFILVIDSNHAILKYGLDFIKVTTNSSWDPVNDKFNAWPFIYGTLITSIVAVLIAIPLSLGIAIFLSEICPVWLRKPVGMLVELLAAIPSVVYGLWGIFIFLPQFIYPVGNFLGENSREDPDLECIVCGPRFAKRCQPARCRFHPCHHDHSHHCCGDAGCISGHPILPTGGFPCAWSNKMGNDLACSFTLWTFRYPRGGDPGYGQGARRNHGCYDGHRQ